MITPSWVRLDIEGNPANPTPSAADQDACDAIAENHPWSLRDAIRRGADVNKLMGIDVASWLVGLPVGLPYLSLAAHRGQSELIRELLAAGAEVDKLGHLPWKGGQSTARLVHVCTPLQVAVLNGSVTCVRLLLEAGADANHSRVYGWFPLHEACSKGHSDIARLLIKHGAEIDPKTRREETSPLDRRIAADGAPLSLALDGGFRGTVLLMLRAGAALKVLKHDEVREHNQTLNDYLIDILNEGGWDARVQNHQNGLLSVVSRCVALPEEVKLTIASFWGSLPH